MGKLIQNFTRGPGRTVAHLNDIVQAVNTLMRFHGDGIIQTVKTPQGHSIKLDINQLVARIPKVGGGSLGVTWARVVRGLQYADPDGDPPEGYRQYKLVPAAATAYDTATSFSVGDVIYLTNIVDEVSEMRVYTCLQPCQGVEPPNAAYWLADTEIQPFAVGTESSGYSASNSDMRDFVRWYHVGDIVPLYIKTGIYYFAQEMTPVVNSSGEKSVSWNADEQRLMAVYK